MKQISFVGVPPAEAQPTRGGPIAPSASTSSASASAGSAPRRSFFSSKPKPKRASADPDTDPDANGKTPESPLDSASLLSRVALAWTFALVRLGYKRPLEFEDLWATARAERPEVVAAAFNREFRGSTVRALYRITRGDVWVSGTLFLCSCALRFAGPFLLSQIVRYVQLASRGQPTQISSSLAFGLAALMAVSQILTTLFHVHSELLSLRVGLRARNALTAVAFERALSLTNASKHKTNTGTLVNLVSSDAAFAIEFSRFLHQAWTAPLVLVAGVAYIQVLIGPSVWAGLTVLFLFVPISYKLGKVEARVQRERMKHADARLKTSNEALQGIRVVKVNAWEESLQRMLDAARDAEMRTLRTLENVRAVTAPLAVAVPNIACVITFMVYVALGNVITPSSAFTVVSLFIIIRQPFVTFPTAISQFTRASVMRDRFDAFLALDLRPADPVSDLPPGTISIESATLSWDGVAEDAAPTKPPATTTSSAPTSFPDLAKASASSPTPAPAPETPNVFKLRDVTLRLSPGEIVAVVGRVGAGKSSLCSAVLRDMTLESGAVLRSGRLAYVGQEPFILNATLRDNVLFGRAMDADRYRVALEVSALTRDVETLPNRDACEIGERGINLSGGQKARVSLARAVYADADVYVLDDPLSAVDAHVGRHILHECLLGHLARKTRLFVTNNLHALPLVDRVVVLEAGRVADVGTYDELVANPDGALSRMLASVGMVPASLAREAGLALAPGSETVTETAPVTQTAPVSETVTQTAPVSETPSKTLTTSGPTVTLAPAPAHAPRLDPTRSARFASRRGLLNAKSSGKLTVTESRAVGDISSRVYKTYWLSGALDSWTLVAALGGLFLCTEAAYLAIDSFLALQSQRVPPLSTDDFLAGFGGITAGFLALLVVRSFAWAAFHVRAAERIFDLLARKILRFPMSFYLSEPLGRILNRLSNDTSSTDAMLGQAWYWFLMCVVRVVGILVLISVVVPIFASALIPLALLYFVVREYYRRSSRELQRIEGVSRSPVFNHLGETLAGAPTLRAYGRVRDWLAEANSRIERNTRAKLATEACSMWLTQYLEFLGALVILVTAVVVVATAGSLGPGLAGLALSFSINSVVNMSFSVKQATLTEALMSSVERVLEFADRDEEADLDDGEGGARDARAVDAAWPAHGRVEFERVVMTYRVDLDPALDDVSFVVPASQRVGICGRTGSGKSSLMVTLFRLYDVREGRVLIDGVDVSRVSKRELRKRLTMVPQDPVVFRASLRDNLDPFKEHADAEIWDVLRQVHAERIAERDPAKLDAPLAENGSNLSVGERALVCLARGILRRSRVVLLDEASAALDEKSDQLVQETIRTRFGSATMLVVAHRLQTIVDLDAVLVMSDGRVAEMGHAAELLRDDASAFAALVRETGEESARALRRVAEDAWARAQARAAGGVGL